MSSPPRVIRPLPDSSGSTLLATAVAGVLNHLLDEAEWARARLQPHTGRVAALEFPAGRIRLLIGDGGRFASEDNDQGSEDLILSFPANAVEGLWSGLDVAMRHVQVSGNAEFGEALGFVLRNLRWDAEADMARLVGDTLAPRIARGARNVFNWQHQAVRRSTENLRDFLVFERPTIVAQPQLRELSIDLLEFRDRMARLEKRLDKLVPSSQGAVPQK